MPKHRPVAAASVVIKPGVPSFVTVVLRGGETFPAVTYLNAVSAEDTENKTNLNFTVSLVTTRTEPHRAVLKLVQNNALSTTRVLGAIPTDGIISITLADTSSGSSVKIPVLEMPVTYIDDPSAP